VFVVSFSQEIHEQPDAIQQLLHSESEYVVHLGNELRNRYQYVVIARGSDNAARYAQYLFGAQPASFAGYLVVYVVPHPSPVRWGVGAGFGSGQSPDIIGVVAEEKAGMPDPGNYECA
jgi:fructoselysine-6-P-deglycase FrlB-like protein